MPATAPATAPIPSNASPTGLAAITTVSAVNAVVTSPIAPAIFMMPATTAAPASAPVTAKIAALLFSMKTPSPSMAEPTDFMAEATPALAPVNWSNCPISFVAAFAMTV